MVGFADFREWPSQLSMQRGERIDEYFVAVVITLATIASTFLLVGSALLFLNVGDGLTEFILGTQVALPVIGTVTLFWYLAITGVLVSAPLAAGLTIVYDGRERLQDDVAAIIAYTGISAVLLAVQGQIALNPNMRAAFITFGLVMGIAVVGMVLSD